MTMIAYFGLMFKLFHRYLCYMLAPNTINKSKKIKGLIFNIFYFGFNEAFLFDLDLSSPIAYGPKSIMINHLKNLDKILKVPDSTKVWIFPHNWTIKGYKMLSPYSGPISEIGDKLAKH